MFKFVINVCFYIILIDFNILFLIFFFKNITDGVTNEISLPVYSRESWKRITVNVTATINSPIELQMVFCWWYVIFTNGYTYGQIKTPMTLHMIFPLVIC